MWAPWEAQEQAANPAAGWDDTSTAAPTPQQQPAAAWGAHGDLTPPQPEQQQPVATWDAAQYHQPAQEQPSWGATHDMSAAGPPHAASWDPTPQPQQQHQHQEVQHCSSSTAPCFTAARLPCIVATAGRGHGQALAKRVCAQDTSQLASLRIRCTFTGRRSGMGVKQLASAAAQQLPGAGGGGVPAAAGPQPTAGSSQRLGCCRPGTVPVTLVGPSPSCIDLRQHLQPPSRSIASLQMWAPRWLFHSEKTSNYSCSLCTTDLQTYTQQQQATRHFVACKMLCTPTHTHTSRDPALAPAKLRFRKL